MYLYMGVCTLVGYSNQIDLGTGTQSGGISITNTMGFTIITIIITTHDKFDASILSHL